MAGRGLLLTRRAASLAVDDEPRFRVDLATDDVAPEGDQPVDAAAQEARRRLACVTLRASAPAGPYSKRCAGS